MNELITQAAKAKKLYALHYAKKLLMLPNIWDVLGAKLLQDLGYAAIATASAAVAYANGYNDGEKTPFAYVLFNLKRIAQCVTVPVTADIESGYAANDDELEKNVHQLIKTGIAGVNIEDTDKETGQLFSIHHQCKRIEIIKKVAKSFNVSLFVNARTDTFIHQTKFNSENELMQETIERGKAYKDAGADCFYPILMHQQNQIQKIVDALDMPVNVLMIPSIPDLKTLEKMNVARISLGPGYLKHAIKSMKKLALKLKNYEGFNDVTNNDLTSDYLEQLISQ